MVAGHQDSVNCQHGEEWMYLHWHNKIAQCVKVYGAHQTESVFCSWKLHFLVVFLWVNDCQFTLGTSHFGHTVPLVFSGVCSVNTSSWKKYAHRSLFFQLIVQSDRETHSIGYGDDDINSCFEISFMEEKTVLALTGYLELCDFTRDKIIAALEVFCKLLSRVVA